jgi:hypothetical protein
MPSVPDADRERLPPDRRQEADLIDDDESDEEGPTELDADFVGVPV